MSEREKTLCVTGLRHHLLEWVPSAQTHETPALPPIVVVHGWMDSAASFAEVARSLAASGRTILAPDLRGYGDTEHIPEQFSYYFADFVRDLHELLCALDLERVDLVGHSMGGSVCTTFAGAFPERVRRLVLVEGLGPDTPDPSDAPMRTRSWMTKARQLRRPPRSMLLEDVVATLARNHPRVPHEVLVRVAPSFVRIGSDGRYTWKADSRHREPWAVPFNRPAFLAHAASITAPTLFVDGGPSGWHPKDESERVASIANVRRATIPDAGHMMHWTHPEALARIVAEFFA